MKQGLLTFLACIFISWSMYAQSDFSAIVQNADGTPLEGANVVLNGTFWQTTTDNTGEFKFHSIPNGKYVVKISFIGYAEISADVTIPTNETLVYTLVEKSILTEEVVIKGVRAGQQQPATYTQVNKEDLEKQNFGQDVPYMLALEPSVVTTSDAGAGIGYTAMRIRGLDFKKINVTINGIPYNDPESQGVYWVDIPDISSSMNSLQIQRGLGKTAGGPGSFGASINIETNQVSSKPYAIIDNSIGSYNSYKNSIQAGTGLIKNHFFAEGRLSRVGSDGYIDRASSKLRSYFSQAGYYSKNTMLRLITFGGFEETYQAWWGTDSSTIDYYGRKFNWAGYYIDKNGNEQFYNKQVDHYTQNHYQLNLQQNLNSKLQLNAILNYTLGKGYYEEYYDNAAIADYTITLPSSIADTSDLVGRKWLDNKLLSGNVFVNYAYNKINLTVGAGFSDYFDAKHFGEIIWSEEGGSNISGNPFYLNKGDKAEFYPYVKLNYSFTPKILAYFDLNYRNINYSAKGEDRENGDLQNIDIKKDYNFLNHIVGLSYTIDNIGVIYITEGISHREPNRSDYLNNVTGSDGPKPEKLYNTEIGLRKISNQFYYEANAYIMLYNNELIKTGQLDDVGNAITKNAGKSSRIGIELNAGFKFYSMFAFKGNIALSKNKTDFSDFSVEINGTDTIVTETPYKNVDISYSPSVVSSAQLIFTPTKWMEFALINKFVGKQYLDNTQNELHSIKGYMVNNVRTNVKLPVNTKFSAELKFQVNNIFNAYYNGNGYMWGITPYYFPQAGRNFMAGLTLNF